MVVPNSRVVLVRFSEISPLSFAEICCPQLPLGREIGHIIVSCIANIGINGLVLLKPFGLGESNLLVLVLEVGVTLLT